VQILRHLVVTEGCKTQPGHGLTLSQDPQPSQGLRLPPFGLLVADRHGHADPLLGAVLAEVLDDRDGVGIRPVQILQCQQRPPAGHQGPQEPQRSLTDYERFRHAVAGCAPLRDDLAQGAPERHQGAVVGKAEAARSLREGLEEGAERQVAVGDGPSREDVPLSGRSDLACDRQGAGLAYSGLADQDEGARLIGAAEVLVKPVSLRLPPDEPARPRSHRASTAAAVDQPGSRGVAVGRPAAEPPEGEHGDVVSGGDIADQAVHDGEADPAGVLGLSGAA
jgi:hypothetical protein